MSVIVSLTKQAPAGKLSFFTGEVDFTAHIGSRTAYVDKTRFLNEWWGAMNKVTLLSRPRRFSKTTVLSMVNAWFTCSNPRELFKNLEVWEDIHPDLEAARDKVASVFFTFKDVRGETYPSLYTTIRSAFLPVVLDHQIMYNKFAETFGPFMLEVPAPDQTHVQALLTNIVNFVQFLSRQLGRKFVVLLDEYDKILLDAAASAEVYGSGYFETVLGMYRNFLSSLFKDTPFVERALLTGVMPLAANSVMSAFNNAVKNTMLDEDYDDIFGFTPAEVDNLTCHADRSIRDAITADLDAYNSGSETILNPWSVIGYIKGMLSGESQPRNTWVLTGNSDWIRYHSRLSDTDVARVYNLISGGVEPVIMNHDLTYMDRTENLNNFLTYAFYTGYLTFSEINGNSVSLVVPNTEVRAAWIYNLDKLIRKPPLRFGWNSVLEALVPTPECESSLASLMSELIDLASYNDLTAENSYHMWVLGMLTTLKESYNITSNREAGNGRFDIAVTPAGGTLLRNYVFEFKKSSSVGKLEEDAESAVSQVMAQRYYKYFDNRYDTVVIGMAGFKKSIRVKIRELKYKNGV